MVIRRGNEMDINEINELVENINEAYNEFIEKNRGERYAIARLFEEFDTYNNGELAEDIVVNMAIGEIIIEQDSVFKGNLECIKKSLHKYENVKEELKKEITEQELEQITVRVNKVLNMLEKMNIDTNPHC
jgi:glutathionyl-hydroquinone reductase